VITMSQTAQETRRRALLECERRFCSNRTEILNGSAVVKSTHELVCMGLDLRLCACTHLLKQEALLVKDAVVDAYVVYGLNVFEHEHAEKERIRQNQAHESQVDQAQGGSRKKCRRPESRQTMLLGVSSGDSHACHAPYESRVHGVHEVDFPGHATVGIQSR
jgi:hypothetical protein